LRKNLKILIDINVNIYNNKIMGMFDTILVKRKLPLTKEIKKAFPDTDWAQESFQTKSLDNTMTTYTIKGTGLYWSKVEGEYVRTMTEEEEKKAKKSRKWVWPYEFVEYSRKTVNVPFHGTINFYHYKEDKDNNTWDIEFDALFNTGKLVSIKLVKGEISTTAEENAARDKEWQDRLDAHENHPWTKTKKILNKITFGYWTKFWSSYVSRGLYWISQKTQKLQLWVIRTLA
jgi:hypothetical protein